MVVIRPHRPSMIRVALVARRFAPGGQGDPRGVVRMRADLQKAVA